MPLLHKEKKETRKIRYTRMVIWDSLIELMQTKSIMNITVKEICELADVSRSTFYFHYKDQYDLLKQIEEETLNCFAEFQKKSVNSYSIKDVSKNLEEIMIHFNNEANSILVLLSENGDVKFRKKLFQLLTKYNTLPQYFAEKEYDDETKGYYSIFMLYGINGVFQHWVKSNRPFPISKLTRMILKWIE